MLLADCHTHSNCSPDSTAPMMEMARGAVRAGLTTLCLTDHCDFLSLDGSHRTPEYDWTPVFQQRTAMLAEFGKKLDLPMGLEFGVGFLDADAAKKVLSQPELDFVIGTVHNLSEEAGGSDFYLGPYETEDDCYHALDDYFSSMIKLAQSEFYDVVGHLIYPLRYMTGNYDSPINLKRYTDQMEYILKLAVESGRGMEINTWKGKTIAEWLPVLKLYKYLRGEIITVGSDAHAPEPLGAGIKDAYAMMKDYGFRYATVYHGRKPDFYKL